MRGFLFTCRLGWAVLLVSLCAAAPTARAKERGPLAAPPEIAARPDPSFHDVLLFIERREVRLGGAQALRITGTYHGRRVGLEVELGAKWQPGSRPDNPRGSAVPRDSFEGEVTLRSIGKESDAWLRALDELYGTGLAPKQFAKETRFNCLSIGGDPRALTKEQIHLKLFYEAGQKVDYAELLLDIDLPGRRLAIREKDEGFRPAVVRALIMR